MTDLNAIKQYQAAKVYREIIPEQRAPEIYERDPGSLAEYRKIIRRGVDAAEATMHQAERAIERLPRPEWRGVLTLRFLWGFDEYETADNMGCSIRTVFRQVQQAVEYLGTAPRGRRPEGP